MFSFPSLSSSRFRSFFRSFDVVVLLRARALESEREFKSENLSETSSISREWISRGKHNFLKTKFLSQPLVVSSNLSPPKTLACYVAENVACSSSLDRSRTIRDNNKPPPKKKKGLRLKVWNLNEIKFVFKAASSEKRAALSHKGEKRYKKWKEEQHLV